MISFAALHLQVKPCKIVVRGWRFYSNFVQDSSKTSHDNSLQSVAWLHYDAWKNQASIPDGNPEQRLSAYSCTHWCCVTVVTSKRHLFILLMTKELPTGSTPEGWGFVSNFWFQTKTWLSRYCCIVWKRSDAAWSRSKVPYHISSKQTNRATSWTFLAGARTRSTLFSWWRHSAIIETQNLLVFRVQSLQNPKPSRTPCCYLLPPPFEDDDDENSMRSFKGVFGRGRHY